MKTTKFFLLTAVAGLMAGQATTFAQKDKTVFYYPVKSAFIEYEHSGSSKGQELFYMDKNGRESARYTQLESKSFGSTTKTDQVMIQEDSVFYTVDMTNKTGVRQTIHLDPKDLEKWTDNAEQAWTDMGFKKTGEGEILGKKCDIWEGMNSKIWVWENFALKTETNLFGKTIVEAKKVEVNVPIDKSKFDIPADISWTEMTINSSDPVFDSIGKGIEKGIKDLKDMFGPKKKK
jgi:hypothetical protein